ncbi:hypothetical protein Pryu01_01735 [Paraliobacillus ryukyuensis]|uniref:Undecaprenyl-diphosphatase n=1 Tax=Paraliobacillus ryukyuensis TaxID=200904 RepID=A0A366E7H0_9BACI|nr:phosphatase PAP2 family protein [Paraliobacillus ryukyuensis]RBO98252.1 undecaprenyl-diphosphatase [Paraliobacillus ryukyuensis]
MQKRFIFHSTVVVSLFLSWITWQVMHGTEPIIDQWSSRFVNQWTGTTFFSIFRWITELGSGSFITPFILIVALLYLLWTKKWFASIWIVAGSFLGYRLNGWIKLIAQRERPSILEEAEGVGFSFPSGHAMGAMITYGLLIYFVSKEVKQASLKLVIQLIGVILILMIGLSRYVINVHYLSDVLAGFGFGYLFIVGWIIVYNIVSKKSFG